jgi:hypothetical protein
MVSYEIKKTTGGADILVCPVSASQPSFWADKNVCPTCFLPQKTTQLRDTTLVIHRHGHSGFETVARDADGYQLSAVLGRRFRLDFARDADGNWEFNLREED